jgi:hypothetical protein
MTDIETVLAIEKIISGMRTKRKYFPPKAAGGGEKKESRKDEPERASWTTFLGTCLKTGLSLNYVNPKNPISGSGEAKPQYLEDLAKGIQKFLFGGVQSICCNYQTSNHSSKNCKQIILFSEKGNFLN